MTVTITKAALGSRTCRRWPTAHRWEPGDGIQPRPRFTGCGRDYLLRWAAYLRRRQAIGELVTLSYHGLPVLQRERYRLRRPVRARAEAWVILTNDNAVSTRRSPPDAGTATSFVKITKPYRRIQDN